ncbi:Asparagine synthetase [glutamine-hydrolyzing] 1 [Paraconexibacter sp. AEG42_29]|uniref:asparagine synthase (glutamine-hydrolyzing) n=1 Tax=Paraconexibacter sp. AEG42_29 TaxID=2997339 RepID=A0AAU7ARP5_9ACTN
MCGFAGELRPRAAVDRDVLTRMSARLAPRGPDGDGVWTRANVGLAHRRLKVIDLSERGAQPMTDDALGLTIVFNGCIYNHHELREELRSLGHAFDSVSDTEVLLRGWAQWGEGLLERLLGMFAFALVDHASGRVTLVRDRLGVKPLYLAPLPDGGLRFGSTLPALVAGGGLDTSVDPVALHHYLSLHAIVPAPRTILNGVRKLPPATVMHVEADGRRTERRWWDPPFTRDDARADWSAEDWRDAVQDATRVAVRRRMVADVPVGILLSGGLDSSLIVGLLAEEGQRGLATFSIGFDRVGDRDGDEFAFSDLVAREFDTDHQQFRLGVDELLEGLPHAIDAMSEPMVSHDAVAFWLLSREVAASRKVVQSGQGADEVFGGYYWYPPLLDVEGDGADEYAAEFFDRDDAQIRRLVQPPLRVDGDPTRAYVRGDFRRAGASTAIDRALRSDAEVMLVDDPVKRVDNMTMAHGLEARTPFLDHELVELAARCPPGLKLDAGGKGVLKAAARGIVPDAVIDREKGYFPVPALSHLEAPVLDLIRDALHAPAARARGLFDGAEVDRMFADPNGHRTNLDGASLWQIGLLELWLQRHV